MIYIFLTADKVDKTENNYINVNVNYEYKSDFQIYIDDLITKTDFTNRLLVYFLPVRSFINSETFVKIYLGLKQRKI